MDTEEKFFVAAALVFVIVLIALGVGTIANAISVDEATNRLAQLANVSPADVQVVRHSNNMIIVGDPFDITLEMIIEGKYVSGRCTSGAFSPMVCRLYTDD